MPYRNYNSSSSKEVYPWMGQVKLTTPDGRKIQRRRQCRTKKEALRWEAQIRATLEREVANSGRQTRMVCLLDWSTAYLDFVRERQSAKTYDEKRMAFRELFAAGIDPDQTAATLTGQEALQYLQGQERLRGGNIANKQRKNLRAAWEWGARFMGLPRENPFATVPRFAEQRTQRRVPTLEEFWRVYEAASNDQDRLMLSCYLQTGARRDELFRLKWVDVDLEGLRVQLFTRKNSAGEWKGGWLPIREELAAMLRRQKKVTGLLRFVFLDQLDEDPQRRVPFSCRQHWLPTLCARAGVEPFGIHGIRLLTASLLGEANMPLIAIKEMLRHGSINTTARYIHSLQKENREVLAALPGIDKSALLV